MLQAAAASFSCPTIFSALWSLPAAYLWVSKAQISRVTIEGAVGVPQRELLIRPTADSELSECGTLNMGRYWSNPGEHLPFCWDTALGARLPCTAADWKVHA